MTDNVVDTFSDGCGGSFQILIKKEFGTKDFPYELEYKGEWTDQWVHLGSDHYYVSLLARIAELVGVNLHEHLKKVIPDD